MSTEQKGSFFYQILFLRNNFPGSITQPLQLSREAGFFVCLLFNLWEYNITSMCLPSRKRGNRLLFTRKAFECSPGDDGPPPVTSSLMTIAIFVAFLFVVEHALREVIRVSLEYQYCTSTYPSVHPSIRMFLYHDQVGF